MNTKYLTIGILANTIEEVFSALNKIIFLNLLLKNKSEFGFQLSVTDLRENYLRMKNFLEKDNIKDENSFFNEFEIEPFGLQVDFETSPSYEYVDILEPIVFMIGKEISVELKTKTIVLFENMWVPVGVFDNGKLVQTFDSYNQQYFSQKGWRPLLSFT